MTRYKPWLKKLRPLVAGLPACLFLASDEASYVTGGFYFVDGGTTISKSNSDAQVPADLKHTYDSNVSLRFQGASRLVKASKPAS